jgi:hypothetical protein
VVTPAVDGLGIFTRPPFDATLLLGAWGALLAVLGNDGWFEMIGESDDQVHRACGRRLQCRPDRGGQNFSGVGEFVCKIHVNPDCAWFDAQPLTAHPSSAAVHYR